jgi:hypothetical protein
MFRALTPVAAVAALAASAAPASAGLLSSPLGVSRAMVTPSGGEILGNDWLKAPPSFTVDPQDGATRHVTNETAKANVRGKAKVPRPGANFGDTPGLGGGDMM